MKQISANITDELWELVLRDRADNESIGTLLERLLRTHPRIAQLKQQLQVEWSERRSQGAPRKVATQP